MRIFFLIFSTFTVFTASAQAQIESDLDAELVTVLSGYGDIDGEPQPENAMAELSLSGSASKVLQNGVEVTARFAFRAQNDHPDRPGFAGHVIDCPPTVAGCPNMNGEGIQGAFSRLTSMSDGQEYGARGSLESAYLAFDGGWGELVLGRDTGVAQRFYEGGPTVFSLARSENPILDPSGINIARVRNDISSTAEKVSVVSPRILGFRIGGSYTPDASVRRLDLNTGETFDNVLEAELGEAWEFGIQGYHFFREADLRLRGSLTWSQASVETAIYDDVETWSYGFELEKRDVYQIGASYLTSSNGGLGDYHSMAAGGAWYRNDWAFKLSGNKSEDEALGLEGWTSTIGFGRSLGDHVDFTLGYRFAQTESNLRQFGTTQSLDREGVLLEIRISE